MTENMSNPKARVGPPWYRRHWVHLVGVGLVGLFFGIGAGAGASPEPETVVVAGPQVTVTPEPEPAVTVTAKAEVVETEVIKPECLEALDAADDFITQTADLLAGPIAGMFDAASVLDFDGMDRNLAQFNADGDDLLTTQVWYVSAAEVCRG